MAEIFKLPVLGNSMEEGQITTWKKQVGETISVGEVICEVMTDKANLDVESTLAGTVLALLVAENDYVPVQNPIAIIGNPGDDISALLAEAGGAAPAAAPAVEAPIAAAVEAPVAVAVATSDVKTVVSPRARRLADQKGVAISELVGQGTGPGGRVIERDVQRVWEQAQTAKPKVTPLAEKMAAAAGLDLGSLAGTGVGGKITSDDVKLVTTPAPAPAAPAAAPAAASAPVHATATSDQVIKFSNMRKRIADAVAKGFISAPPVTEVMEVDMTAAADFRKMIIPEVERIYGYRTTFTDFIVKAVTIALKEFPELNSTLNGDELTLKKQINVGVAVAMGDILMAPAILGCNDMSLGQMCKSLRELVDRTKAGKASLDELTGGTFTITNLGNFGVDYFTPILIPGQAGILGVCRIADKVVAKDGEIVIRKMMNLCLTFDHRIVDGAPAAQFLKRVKELLESPMSLLL
ncbi:MAG: 2-oxo acid dehydrogenase subunit E2 [Armatimonadota bacterium]